MNELIAQRFEVLRALGSGGLGDVVLVRDRRDGATRALKRLRPADDEAAERFRSEFAELAALSHPNIVRVYEYGRLDDGGAWITMEAIDGQPADRALRPGDVLGALRVALDAIAGLDALHAAGRFHGDVTPSNLLVGARAVLIDFGFMGREHEMPGGKRRGTPGYLAPEVLSGAAPYGRASDAYALGATLYRVLAGRPAFPGRDPAAILAAQSRGEPSRLPLESAGVPQALIELVLRLLSPDAAGRGAALEDLRELASRRLARRDGAATQAVLASSGPLLGRDAERRALAAHVLRGAGVGGLRIALIAGPAGSGRTRLAHEIAIEAGLAGWTVEWHDAKSLSRPGDAPVGDPRGTLHVLDDVDTWPEAALEAFRLERDPQRPLAVLATARSARLEGQPFLRWCLAISDAEAPRVVELGPLAADASADLVRARLGGTVSSELVDALVREGAGQPGVLVSFVGRLVDANVLRRSGSEWTLAPGQTAEAAVRSVAHAPADDLFADLSSDARRTLVALAGWIEPTDAARLETWTALSPEAVASALEDLEWRGWSARDRDGRWRIVAPSIERLAIDSVDGDGVAEVRDRLARELEANAVGGPRALRLLGSHRWALGDHAAAIDAWRRGWDARDLAERTEVAELARTVEERDLGQGEAAAALLAAIAEHWQTVQRPAIAEGLWARAAEATDPQESAFIARCLVERVRCLYRVTRITEGIALLDDLINRPAFGALSLEARGDVLTERGWGRALSGRAVEARADWDEALRTLPASALAERVIVQNRYASFHIQWGEFDSAQMRLRDALDGSLSLGDRSLESRVRANVAQLAANEGRYEDARTEYEHLIPLTRTVTNAYWYPIQLTNLLTIYAHLGDWAGWRRTIEEVMTLARSSGDVALLCGSLDSRVSLAIRQGDLPTARRALRTERSWLALSNRYDQHAHYKITSACVRGLAGDQRSASRSLRFAYQLAAERPHPLSMAQSAVMLGDLWLRDDRVDRAYEWYRRAVASGYRGQNLAVLALLGLMRCALRRRDDDDARTRARELESALDTAPPLEVSAIRSEVRAVLALVDGNAELSAEKYRLSVDSLVERALLLRAAETMWEAARAMDQAGRTSLATDFLEEAWQLTASTQLESWRSKLAVALRTRVAPTPLFGANGTSEPATRDLLARVAVLMNSLLDYPALIQKSLEIVAEHLHAERGHILLVSSDTGEVRPVAQYGPVTDESQESALSYSRSIVRRVASSGEAFRADDAANDPRLGSTQSVLDLAVRSVLCTPLRLREELIGTVYLESRSSAAQFGESDLELLEAFSNLLAIAIDNSRKFESLRRSRERVIGVNLSLRNDVGSRFQPSNIIGRSAEIERVLDEIELIANSKGTVLITGESGTGKELIAKTIHYNSPRREHPFLSLNCAALSTDLIEAELFGIESHAATGVQGRPGIFERADKGTLFLDEIGDMPTGLQAKLLRVLQEREFVRVGTTGRVVQVDVRLIAATNKDLTQMIREGQFREDLFFRLHALPIHIAPLRERKADILPLAEYFLRRFCEENSLPLPALSAEFKAELHRHDWPGNVRELQHFIERAVVMSPGATLKSTGPIAEFGSGWFRSPTAAIPPSSSDLKVGQTLKDALEDFEERVIRGALEKAKGNQRQAAKALGLVEPTLRYKMGKLQIDAKPTTRRR